MSFYNIGHASIDDTPKLLPFLSELGYPPTLKDLNRRFLKFVKNPSYGVAVCEMNEEIVINGQKVLPEKAMRHGFEFFYPTIQQSLSKIFR